MKHLLATALAAALMGLAGCGGGGEGGVGNDPGPPVAGGPTPAPLPPPAQPDPLPPYELGGQVTGLSGTVTLLSNLGERVHVSSNGAYLFTNKYGSLASYLVEVERQPSGQRCTVQGGSGLIPNNNVYTAGVSCQAVAPEQPTAGAPAAPLQFDIAYGPKSYTLTWAVVAGATSYRVGRDVDGDGPAGAVEETTAQNVATRKSIFVPDEAKSTVYVRACNASGCSPRSRIIQPSPVQLTGELEPAAGVATDRYFGYNLATSADGSVLAVAQPMGADSGVHVFVRNNDRWILERIFKPADMTWVQGVAVSGDGKIIAAGDSDVANGRGRVYVLDRDSGAVAELAATVSGTSDEFGASLAMSTDGSVLVIGAPGEDAAGADPQSNQASRSGAAYIFTRTGQTWQQQAFLKAGAPVAGAEFGSRVSIAGNGNRVAIGAIGEASSTTGINPQPNDQAPWSGAVYTFVRDGNNWNLEAFIKAPNPDSDDMFGYAVKLSEAGDTLLVGAPGEASAATWGGGGNPADNSVPFSGAAYLYSFAGNSWSLERYIKSPVGRSWDSFGAALTMDGTGTLLAIAATGDSSAALAIDGPQADAANYGSGAVHLYRKVAGSWTFSHYVKSRRSQTDAYFGHALDLSRDGLTLPVGSAFVHDGSFNYHGRVDIY